MQNSAILQVLRIRPFLFLWLAEVFSQIGMNMINFVLIVIVFKLTNSNTAVSGVVLSFILPAILLGIFAGVVTDRIHKKKVLLVTNIIRAILLFALVFVNNILFFVYLISFLVSLATQFFIPAETPMIPVIVKKELLLPANALFSMGIYGSVLIAYALTGSSLLVFGENYIFLFLSFLFIIASFLISFIDSARVKEIKKDTSTTFMQEVSYAFSFFKKNTNLYDSLFLLALSQLVILILAVIGPGYAQNILKIQVETFPLIFVTPAAGGMVCGALVLTHFFKKYSKEKIANYGLLLCAVAIGALPLIAFFKNGGEGVPTVFIVGAAFLLGFANAFIFVPSNTILQEKTNEGERGKVYGLLNSVTGIVSLVPIIAVGGLSDLFGVGKVLVGIALVIGIIGVLRIL